jgi:hypothetical protein
VVISRDSAHTKPAGHCEAALMRDWLLILVPVALGIYFVIYPHQLMAAMDWLARLIR